MYSLDRLNRLVDGEPQREFNRFIGALAMSGGETALPAGTLAWTPTNPMAKRALLLAARTSGRFDGLA